METIESCISKIKKYLDSESFRQPFFVNVNTVSDLNALKNEIPMGIPRRSAAEFCQTDDGNPAIDMMLDFLQKNTGSVLLTDLIPALELQGSRTLKHTLSMLAGMSIPGKVIVLCYQAMHYFNDFTDTRFSRRFVQVNGIPELKPQIILIPDEYDNDAIKPKERGIKKLLLKYETLNCEKIFVVSKRKRADFADPCLYITEENCSYDILSEIDSNVTAFLEKKYGTEEQWNELLKKYRNGQKWHDIVHAELGQNSNLSILIQSWHTWNEFQRWIFFMLLKANMNQETGYLYRCADSAECMNDFIKCVYREILAVPPDSPAFPKVYEERKKLLNALKNPVDEVCDFCKYVDIKQKDAICYLTDNTQREREKIIELLSKYDYFQGEIHKILEYVYPELADYLTPYQFENEVFTEYFKQYQYQKVMNRITPEFEKTAEEQAKSRDYNKYFPARAAVVEDACEQESIAYWIDALGVEFLGLISKLCPKKGLAAKITVCRANLPTITSLNKEFETDFQNKGISLTAIKELDEIVHKGKDNFDYEKTKLPIHLIREMEIIRKTLDAAAMKLKDGLCKKVIIVSDHGASRLAVIKESTIDIDVDSKGTHGGRCCAYKDTLPKLNTAVNEDDYYILADYNRFKGGRKASVETHGGATLEEILVPVIELTLGNSASVIEVKFMQESIPVSFRKKAAIQLFSKTALNKVSICIQDKYYQGKAEGNFWNFEMPDLKRAGTYYADIYDNDNLIASQLSFKIVKEGAKENKLF